MSRTTGRPPCSGAAANYAGGSPFGYLGSLGSKAAQDGALSAQIIAVGAISSGLSRVPARTRIGSPFGSSVLLYICDPHFGQNPRSTVFPLSAVRRSVVISP